MCTLPCRYCGAQYATDVKFVRTGPNQTLQVASGRLRTQHTALRNQKDYIDAMLHTQAAVKILGKNIPQLKTPLQYPGAPAAAPGGPAFAYSLFYVYYEQYSYIQGVAIQNVLAAICKCAPLTLRLCLRCTGLAGVTDAFSLGGCHRVACPTPQAPCSSPPWSCPTCPPHCW